jgi:HSP20 family protein
MLSLTKSKGGCMSTNALSKKVERFPSLFEDFFKPWNEFVNTGGSWGRTLTTPAVNITENKDNFHVTMAIPGMKKNDFNIDVNGNLLTISSEKEESKDDSTQQYTRREYSYSSFSRSFTLPDDVNKEKIDAVYDDGVLKLTLPKKEEAKHLASSKHISVK